MTDSRSLKAGVKKTVGMIGAGGISRAHAPGWLELGYDLVIYSQEGAQELAQETGGRAVDTVEELLDVADIVDVVTPTPNHVEYAAEALQRGVNVVVEKPVARTMQQARTLLEAASGAGGTGPTEPAGDVACGRGTASASAGGGPAAGPDPIQDAQIYPAHVVRFFPAYAAAHAAVQSGKLGAPAVARFTRVSASPIPAREWFGREAESGGIILDQMLHDLDQALWMFGPVTRVFAVQSPLPDSGKSPVITSAQVTLTHANGAISLCRGVWGPPHLPFYTQFSVAGSRGTITHDSRQRQELTQNLSAEGGGYLPADSPGESPYTTEIKAFAAAFKGGPTPPVTLQDGVNVLEVALAAIKSRDTGKPVDLGQPADDSTEGRR